MLSIAPNLQADAFFLSYRMLFFIFIMFQCAPEVRSSLVATFLIKEQEIIQTQTYFLIKKVTSSGYNLFCRQKQETIQIIRYFLN